MAARQIGARYAGHVAEMGAWQIGADPHAVDVGFVVGGYDVGNAFGNVFQADCAQMDEEARQRHAPEVAEMADKPRLIGYFESSSLPRTGAVGFGAVDFVVSDKG